MSVGSEFPTKNQIYGEISEHSNRKYTFDLSYNDREYEWKTEEAEELFDAFNDATDENKLDLGQLILVLNDNESFVSDFKKKYGRESRCFMVQDGQQRIVSSTLLLAAIRDRLQHASEIEQESTLAQKLANDAKLIGDMVNPPSHRGEPIVRIFETGDQKSNEILKLILVEGTSESSMPESYPKSKHCKAYKTLSSPAKCMLRNYEYFKSQVKEMTPRQAFELYESIRFFTIVRISFPQDLETARSMVMHQSKGKNLTLIDEIKRIICKRRTTSEDRRTSALIEWKSLCDSVGRPRLTEVCLLLAQKILCKRVAHNREREFMEKCLKIFCEKNGKDGYHFLRHQLAPAAYVWHDFVNDSLPPLCVNYAEQKPSFSLLRNTMATITGARQKCAIVGTPLLMLLMHYEHTAESAIVKEEIEAYIRRQFESIALWVLLTSSRNELKTMEEMVFSVLKKGDSISHLTSLIFLSSEKKEKCIQRLMAHDFEGEDKLSKILLDRLNEHRCGSPVVANKRQVSVVQIDPQKGYLFGNLVLTTSRCARGLQGCSNFSDRKKHFIGSGYPMTKEAGQLEEISDAALHARHESLLEEAVDVWRLRQRPLSLSQTQHLPSPQRVETSDRAGAAVLAATEPAITAAAATGASTDAPIGASSSEDSFGSSLEEDDDSNDSDWGEDHGKMSMAPKISSRRPKRGRGGKLATLARKKQPRRTLLATRASTKRTTRQSSMTVSL